MTLAFIVALKKIILHSLMTNKVQAIGGNFTQSLR